MIQSRHFRRIAKSSVVPVLGVLLIAYFIYHAIQGDRGVLSWIRLSQDLERLETKHSALVSERQALEEKVQGLRPESINPDLLDFQVRKQLGYTHPHEVVILMPSDELNYAQ